MLRATSAGKSLDDVVTEHMRTDFAKLNAGQTVGEALETVRLHPPEGRVIYFYVVDDENRLAGVVPTRRLLMSPLNCSIRDVMVPDVIVIPSTATVLDACEFFIFHRLLAFPVVDEEGRMLGIVDVELYTDELSDLERREGNDELFQLIGVHLADAQATSSWSAFRGRFPWLMANIAGGILAAFLSGLYETELQLLVALALFIPVVLALAESVSIQSVSLALQVLRGRRPTLNSIVRKVKAEAMTGAFLGIACGLTVAAVALAWLGNWVVVVCLLGGIAGSVMCAAMIGVAIPNLLRFFHCEPQVAAGPVALASTDMATLLIYFNLARLLL